MHPHGSGPVVVYQDRELVAVHKPAGLPVHGPNLKPGVEPVAQSSHLEGIVKAQFGSACVLLHRLDRGTSGLVLFAKNKRVAGVMSRAFEAKQIRKAYLAVVHGAWPPNFGRVESFLLPSAEGRMQSAPDNESGRGSHSVTSFRVLAKSDEATFLEALPKTGRRHQIRVHASANGHPIFGDRLYGASLAPTPSSLAFALHAYRMDFQHPVSGEPLRILASPTHEWRENYLSAFSKADAILQKA